MFIACSNRRGAEPPWATEFFGDSHVIGPNGPLVNRSDHRELVICDVDLTTLQQPDSSGWSLRDDRRPDIYSH